MCWKEIPPGTEPILQVQIIQICLQVGIFEYYYFHQTITLSRSKLKPIPASDDDYLRIYKTEKKQQELDELVAEQRRRLSLKLIL